MKRLLIFLACLISSSAFASKYPVITSIRSEITSSTSEAYYITQEILEIGPAADQRIPVGWGVGLAHKHYYTSSDIPVVAYTGAPTIAGPESQVVGPLAITEYNRDGYRVSRINHNGALTMPGHECIGYVAASASDGVPWDSAIAPAGCVSVPPADEWCKITTPVLLLDHGTVALSNTEGHSASTSLGVNCTTPMSITFQLAGGQPYIYLSPLGTANIQVGDKPLESKIDVPAGQSTLTVKDILSGVSTEGVTSGSSVLIMSPY